MTYSAAQARQELLDELAQATDRIGVGLAAVGGAYELLDEYNADRLEAELFRPVQLGYGRAKRTHDGFAERSGLPAGSFASATAGAPSHGVKGFLEDAVDAIEEADMMLGRLQDSMMPVEVGDAELRADLAEVRRLIGGVGQRARQFVATVGR